MLWDSYVKGFYVYLRLEKSLAGNSIDSYSDDIHKLIVYLEEQGFSGTPSEITLQQLRDFLKYIFDAGYLPTSQARIVSGVKAFFKYLWIEQIISFNPAELLDAPKLTRKLPDVLYVHEIDAMIASLDLSKPEGLRNKTIVETMFSCGLRVSEAVSLRRSDIYRKDEFLRIIGKGNKERLVPIGQSTLALIQLYEESVRNSGKIAPGFEDVLFLNRFGKNLSRVMVFMLIKKMAADAGIHKQISPHTLRHSFASSMVEAGADIRAVQQMLGHESITTTEIYMHIDRAFLHTIVREFHPRAGKK